VAVKTALAEKYENLARVSGSKPKTARLLNKANRFRRQARELARG
jgi:hypothetical protein